MESSHVWDEKSSLLFQRHIKGIVLQSLRFTLTHFVINLNGCCIKSGGKKTRLTFPQNYNQSHYNDCAQNRRQPLLCKIINIFSGISERIVFFFACSLRFLSIISLNLMPFNLEYCEIMRMLALYVAHSH